MRPGPWAGMMATLSWVVAPRLPAFRMAPNSSPLRTRRSRPNRARPREWGTATQGLSLMGFPRMGSYAPRRCLPLARRLFITSLPPRDLMRTRKPCVLLLRRLLGWNVLFTVLWNPCEKWNRQSYRGLSGSSKDVDFCAGPGGSACYGYGLSRGSFFARHRASFSGSLVDPVTHYLTMRLGSCR